MKYLLFSILLSVTLASGSFAEEAGKTAQPTRKAARQELIKKYDKDGDGKLSKAEKKALQKDRRAEMVKRFDTDGDGKLSNSERETMRETLKKNKDNKGKKARKAKKAQKKTGKK